MQFYEPMARVTTELTGRYSEDELRQLVDFLRAGREALREHREQVIARASRRAR
jgi:hypothetical protein